MERGGERGREGGKEGERGVERRREGRGRKRLNVEFDTIPSIIQMQGSCETSAGGRNRKGLLAETRAR